jgi:hypothetical protein
MFKSELRPYRRRLLEGGMAWHAVLRHLRELEDHHRDLHEQAVATGLSDEAAAERARQQIGDLDQLATQMLASSQRSLLHRFPVTMNVFCPVFLLFACYIVPLFLLISFLDFSQPDLNPFDTAPQWLRSFLPPFAWLTMYAVPFLVILPLVYYAHRARVPLRYWVGGVVLLCALGAGLDIHIGWPDPEAGRAGSIGYSIYGHIRNLDRYVLRFALNLLLVALGLAWYCRSRERVAEQAQYLDGAR